MEYMSGSAEYTREVKKAKNSGYWVPHANEHSSTPTVQEASLRSRRIRFDRIAIGVTASNKTREARGQILRVFEITFEQYSNMLEEADSACTYCGTISTTTLPGLDRIDNNGQYTIDNVVIACAACNYNKSTDTVTNYLQRCYNVHATHRSGSTDYLMKATLADAKIGLIVQHEEQPTWTYSYDEHTRFCQYHGCSPVSMYRHARLTWLDYATCTHCQRIGTRERPLRVMRIDASKDYHTPGNYTSACRECALFSNKKSSWSSLHSLCASTSVHSLGALP